MQKLSEKILAKIKSENISPREKWIFLVKNYGIWVLAILGIVLAGVFVGNIISDLHSAEWDIMHRFPGGKPNFLFHTIPFLWLFGIASAFTFTFFLLRKTKHGYRFGILAISGTILIVSSIAGVALLSTPLPPKFREFRMQNFPPSFEASEWNNPSEGFLFGEILEVGEKILILNAFDESIWEVDVSEARIPPLLKLKEKLKVRVIGKQIRDGKFRADFVKPEISREALRKIQKIQNERKFNLPAY